MTILGSIHSAYRWLRRRLYRRLHEIGEWRERNEVRIALFESIAAAIGTLLFGARLMRMASPGEAGGHEAPESMLEWGVGPIETAILVILTLSLISRAAVLMRRRGLGLSFAAIVSRIGGRRQSDRYDPKLLDDLAAMRHGASSLGQPLGGKAGEVEAAIKALARASASVFSERTYDEPDLWWEYWEAIYFADWHAAEPRTIWRVAAPSRPGSAYFSVVLPVTPLSYERFRRGHLHSAMSTITASGADAESAHLLVYSALYVAADEDERWDGRLLLYTSIEHLAALVAHRWPEVLAAGPSGRIRIICESSNASLDAVLETLGFHPIFPEHDEPEEGRKGRAPKPVYSPSGFKLYEIAHDPAVPEGDTANLRGLRFIELLRKVAGVAAPAKPPARRPRRKTR